MSDLELKKNCKRGDKKGQVVLIQEWLCLHGHHVRIDGDFGPATESAVKAFQVGSHLPPNGVVEAETFQLLIAPMLKALAPIQAENRTVGEMVVAYAQQHLKQHPREIGGQNRGPWVRLYMEGNEGIGWAWCAGFACFCIKQVCKALNEKAPLECSFSCDSLAASAKNCDTFLKQPSANERQKILPGSLFLVRRTDTDWIHTGIVVQAENEIIRTIEGNTNDDGSREGYEVCARTRGYSNMDFVLL